VADWITPEDVAAQVGGDVLPDEPRLVLATAAARAAVERRRTDLAFADDVSTPGDVRQGAILWAALIYGQRSAPSGYDGFDAESAFQDASSKRGEIFKLLGIERGGRPVSA
jgi:hypothetical protein